jgi:hypothetical protein
LFSVWSEPLGRILDQPLVYLGKHSLVELHEDPAKKEPQDDDSNNESSMNGESEGGELEEEDIEETDSERESIEDVSDDEGSEGQFSEKYSDGEAIEAAEEFEDNEL